MAGKDLTQINFRFAKEDLERVNVLRKELRIETKVDIVRHAIKTLYDLTMRKKFRRPSL